VSGALFHLDENPLTEGCHVANVFEPLVRAKYHEIDEALTALGQFAPARLTGTGACVFAAFADERQARQAAEQLANRWQTIVAAGRNRSPLLAHDE
jgi:4-diphosphocytidyl-2-C-methyl-D-erythritol kinase